MTETTANALLPQRRAEDRANDLTGAGTGTGLATRLPAQWQQALGAAGVRRFLPAVAACLAIAIVLFAANALRTPDRVAVFAGLPDAEKAAVMERLGEGGFDAALDPVSGNPTVPRSDLHRARMALAAAGLPETGATGYDLLTDMPFGTSRAVEAARLRQTQETELARSIEAMRGVKSARVHIAVPEPSAFVRATSAPTASVFLDLADARVLGEGQVMAIGHLVSSSVPGLAAERVSIVDQRGALLSRRGGATVRQDRELDYRARLEQQWRDRIAAIMTPLYGQAGYSAEVALDLDFTATESTSETFGRDAMLRSEQRRARPAGGANGARGIPGTLSNQPPPGAVLTDDVNADERDPETSPPADTGMDESYTRNFELDKAVAVSRAGTAALKRASVAVVIREGETSLREQDIAAAEAMLEGALGIDADRGDSLVVRAHRFETPADGAEPLPIYRQPWVMEWASLGTVLVLGLVALFLVARPLIGGIKALASAPAGGADANAAEVTASTSDVSDVAVSAPYEARLESLRALVSEDRDRAFGALSQLMTADDKATAG
ncbi:MAG: flagellar basal-body MS-ring/collar protein FliF [Pseudomonadota bacterium]